MLLQLYVIKIAYMSALKIRSVNRLAFLANIFNLAIIEMISIKAISASVFSSYTLSLNHHHVKRNDFKFLKNESLF